MPRLGLMLRLEVSWTRDQRLWHRQVCQLRYRGRLCWSAALRRLREWSEVLQPGGSIQPRRGRNKGLRLAAGLSTQHTLPRLCQTISFWLLVKARKTCWNILDKRDLWLRSDLLRHSLLTLPSPVRIDSSYARARGMDRACSFTNPCWGDGTDRLKLCGRCIRSTF